MGLLRIGIIRLFFHFKVHHNDKTIRNLVGGSRKALTLNRALLIQNSPIFGHIVGNKICTVYLLVALCFKETLVDIQGN